MKLGAIIIENRFDVTKVIENHKKFLPEDFGIMHIIPKNVKTEHDYNAMLTSYEFWDNLPFDKVLIFQHDSGLLRTGIEEFLGYDYVGAPWINPGMPQYGGNGGLSVRSVGAMKKCIDLLPWSPKLGNEDLYYSNILARNHALFNLAPREVCAKFSCETQYMLGTLGYHCIDKWLTPEQCKNIYNQYI